RRQKKKPSRLWPERLAISFFQDEDFFVWLSILSISSRSIWDTGCRTLRSLRPPAGGLGWGALLRGLTGCAVAFTRNWGAAGLAAGAGSGAETSGVPWAKSRISVPSSRSSASVSSSA